MNVSHRCLSPRRFPKSRKLRKSRAGKLWIGLLVAVGWGAEIARAQGTAVQLPSSSYFTANTTVSVPDRGSAYLGGMARARSASNQFGAPLTPFGNRAMGSDRSISGASVSVYIHDFAALEKELLARSAGRPAARAGAVAGSRAVAGSPDPATGSAEGLQDRWGDLRSTIAAGSGDPRRAHGDPRPVPEDRPLPSIEEIRRQRRLDREARQSEARDFLQRGRIAEQSGKKNVARIYYQMAAKRASGPLEQEVLSKLESIRREQTVVAGQNR